jgi:hypothetical protein
MPFSRMLLHVGCLTRSMTLHIIGAASVIGLDWSNDGLAI